MTLGWLDSAQGQFPGGLGFGHKIMYSQSALILVEGVFCEKQERTCGEEPAKEGPGSSWDLQVFLYYKQQSIIVL